MISEQIKKLKDIQDRLPGIIIEDRCYNCNGDRYRNRTKENE